MIRTPSAFHAGSRLHALPGGFVFPDVAVVFAFLEGAGGGLVNEGFGDGVHLEDAGGVHRGDGAFGGVGDGLGFAGAEGEEEHLPAFHDRADAHGDAVHGNLGEVAAKEAAVVFAAALG